MRAVRLSSVWNFKRHDCVMEDKQCCREIGKGTKASSLEAPGFAISGSSVLLTGVAMHLKKLVDHVTFPSFSLFHFAIVNDQSILLNALNACNQFSMV